MFTLKHENKYGRLFTLLFFACVVIEVTAEMFSNKLLIYYSQALIINWDYGAVLECIEGKKTFVFFSNIVVNDY